MLNSRETETIEKSYPLDSYHTGIRVVTLISMLIGVIFGGLLIPLAIDALGLTVIPKFWAGILGAIVFLFVFGSMSERLLQSRWTSGRWASLSSEAVKLYEKDGKQITLLRSQPIDMALWYFVIPRKRATVQKGWYCAACYLSQGDQVVCIYAFVEPEQAQSLAGWKNFQQLYPLQLETSRDKADQPLDKQIELRQKERQRWQLGAEMKPHDFQEILNSMINTE